MGKTSIFEVKDNGVAVLTLNRPDQLNALNIEMIEEIIQAGDEVSRNEDIKVLVLTGAGRGFSTDGDISMMSEMDGPQKAKWTFDLSTRAVKAVYQLEKPVIAAINGPVAGASTSLMMACDLVIASEKAVFGFTFINIAFCPDSGCSYFLAQRVGYQKAAEILWFGRVLGAEEALNLRLVNAVVPDGESLDKALAWADKLAVGPSRTLVMDKKLLRQAQNSDFYQQAELEGSFQVLAWLSEDYREGTSAFLEKRRPNFQGR